MTRVRFAPSPTGSLHVGSALTAVANRSFADERDGAFVLRIDDTDPTRVEPGAEEAILRDLEWLGIAWDEGPLRQSERANRYARGGGAAARGRRGEREDDGAVRFAVDPRPTLLRADGTATYHLASVVDDADQAITHVIRGKDHLANATLHADARTRSRGRAARVPPPRAARGPGRDEALEAPRRGLARRAARARHTRPRRVRRYLEELGLPTHDVHYDEQRLRRLAVEALARALRRGARRARRRRSVASRRRCAARTISSRRARWRGWSTERPPPSSATDRPTRCARFRRAARAPPGDARPRPVPRAAGRVVREGGGDLQALRLALTGRAGGPELWAVLRGAAARRGAQPGRGG